MSTNSSSLIFPLYPVRVNGRFGYIDRLGKMRITPQYTYGGKFREGLAEVKVGDTRAFIDCYGEVHAEFICQSSGILSEGVCPVSVIENGKEVFGLIDVSGKIVVKPRFDFCGTFRNGLCSITLKSKQGFIDKSGEFRISPKFDFCWDFQRGQTYTTMRKAHLWYIGSLTGGVSLLKRVQNARGVAEGVIPVVKDSTWQFIACDGSSLDFGFFESTGHCFHEGMIGVKNNGKWGAIGIDGSEKVPCCYHKIDNYCEGFAPVAVEISSSQKSDRKKKWGYVDKSGTLVIEPKYDYVFDFCSGVAEFWVGDPENLDYESGYIDIKGSVIWGPSK